MPQNSMPETLAPGSMLSIFLHDAGAHGKADQAGDIVDAEAFHQKCAMGFDGLYAHVKPRRDLLRACALGDKLENLPLSRRKRLQRPCCGLAGPPVEPMVGGSHVSTKHKTE